ncbi:GAF and ANTAR domain-containing protein [Actinoplanes sp. NPDC049265]|uniref:GAF and ANTAR domain-containing protein n=1 Tax=Actinoplanes sp. NPDC049265 TaxID=3363902 RepID=UPI00371DD988
MDDQAQTVRRLVADTTRPGMSTAVFLHHVCQAAARALSASGVGISVMTDDGAPGMCAASDPLSERVEELQFITGEGPCIDAFTTRRPVLVPDLDLDATHRRWPGYAPAAVRDGVRAEFAFPLQIGAARLGILDVFRQRAGPLNGTDLPLALTFADVTVEALLDRKGDTSARTGDGTMPSALTVDVGHRAELFQAQGMVMVQLGVSLGEALVRMRAYAYAQSRRLDEVARDVVAQRLRFDQDRP